MKLTDEELWILISALRIALEDGSIEDTCSREEAKSRSTSEGEIMEYMPGYVSRSFCEERVAELRAQMAELTRERDDAVQTHDRYLERIDKLTRERDEARFLALNGICHDAVGDEWGHFPCPYKARAEAAERERDGYLRAKDTWKGLQEGTAKALAQAEIERDALREQVAWQPIESAPKDGTDILVAETDGDIRKASWWSEQRCVDVEGGEPEDYQAGWYTDDEEDVAPRYWMPLPSFPADGEG